MNNPRTALVLGATGGSGGEIAAALLRRGWKVRALVRDTEATQPGAEHRVACRRRDECRRCGAGSARRRGYRPRGESAGLPQLEQGGTADARQHDCRGPFRRGADRVARHRLQLWTGRHAVAGRNIAAAAADPQGCDPGGHGTSPGTGGERRRALVDPALRRLLRPACRQQLVCGHGEAGKAGAFDHLPRPPGRCATPGHTCRTSAKPWRDCWSARPTSPCSSGSTSPATGSTATPWLMRSDMP